MKGFSKRQLVMIGVGIFALLVAGIIVAFNLRQGIGPQVTLTVWGTDDPSVWDGTIQGYKLVRRNAEVDYRKIDAGNYRSELLDALASGKGPDIFFIGNRDLWADKEKIATSSPSQFGLSALRQFFPTVVEQDFTIDGQVFALPLYIDTMAMLVNRDLFDQAGIATIPTSWEEFLRDIPKLRSISSENQILRAAAAIGGSEATVDAGTDLLQLLLMQNGAKMNDESKASASFASESGYAGFRAFDFYLQFANAGSPYFTWNDGQRNSVEAFAGGKIAAIFDYASALARIKKIGPFLNVRAAQMLQPLGASQAVNFARYEGLAVSRQSRIPGWAWDFVTFAATDQSAAKSYSDATSRPPALLSLISRKSGDPDLEVFAGQALTARSWVVPSDAGVRDILNRAIQDTLGGKTDSPTALSQAEGQINQLFIKNR